MQANASGAVTLDREYDAWGVLTQGSGASGYAFAGREWDAETGLYFYRARYDEPTSARFIGELARRLAPKDTPSLPIVDMRKDGHLK